MVIFFLNYISSILNTNHTLIFYYFYNFKTFKLSFKYPKQKSYILFVNYFFNFKTFKLSFKYPKQKSYLRFFNYFYNFKTFELSFKYPKQKSYLYFFLIIFIILKHLNYPSSMLNRNPTYFFFNYFYNFKTFKLSFKYCKQKSCLLFILIIFIILKHLNYVSSI